MEVKTILILLQLLLAHVLTDFVLQSGKMVAHKEKHKGASWVLYAHAILAGILTYLLLQNWTQFVIPIIVTVTHFLIDLWKLHQKKDKLTYFIIDQVLHLIVLVVAWLYLINGFEEVLPTLKEFMSTPAKLAIFMAYLLVIFPVGFVIGKFTERWQQEIEKEEKEQSSLKKAGRYIGIFERILVLTFILSGNFSAIGFLIGAKSILRFSDSKGARKQTEYVLIGTLMSFAICIVIGLLVLQIMQES